MRVLQSENTSKLSWECTAAEMAASGENWDEWRGVESDGLILIPWESGKRGEVPTDGLGLTLTDAAAP